MRSLAHAGFFPDRQSCTSCASSARACKGIPIPTCCPARGSLHRLARPGAFRGRGLAAGLRLTGEDGLVFTVLGDGECEEGQVWEAVMFAAHQKLGRLWPSSTTTSCRSTAASTTCAIRGFGREIAAFGWDVQRVCGHDILALIELFGRIKAEAADTARPVCVIARTVKGKGVSFMENQAGWHGKAPKPEELEKALAELSADAE